MKKEQMEALLTSLLGCGYLDLDILDGCEYDMIDLIGIARDEMGYEKLDINNLCCAMFEMGKREIQDFLNDRIEELKDNDDLTEEEKTELDQLETLEIFEDISSFHNFIDTSISIDKNADIYTEYLKSALDNFEEKTGFSIGY